VCHDPLTQQRRYVSASLPFECYASIGDEMMTLIHRFGIMALAVSAFAQPQVKSSEADTSTLIPTARIIQALPEVNELNESRKSTMRSLNPTRFGAISPISGTGPSTVPIY
jgi:hypothetical protein